jgi:hypothetical protein
MTVRYPHGLSLATPDPRVHALISGKINSRIMNSPWFNGAEKFAHRVS